MRPVIPDQRCQPQLPPEPRPPDRSPPSESRQSSSPHEQWVQSCYDTSSDFVSLATSSTCSSASPFLFDIPSCPIDSYSSNAFVDGLALSDFPPDFSQFPDVHDPFATESIAGFDYSLLNTSGFALENAPALDFSALPVLEPVNSPVHSDPPSNPSPMPAATYTASSASSTTSRDTSPKEPACRVTKRQLNTQAARRYRQRKVDRVNELEAELEKIKKERDELRMRVSKLEGETEALRGMVQKQN